MIGIISAILVSFCAFFIAIDGVGLLPSFGLLTDQMKNKETKKNIITSIYVALGIGIGLLIVCSIMSFLLKITKTDFQIGGGIVLFILSIHYLLKNDAKKKINQEAVNMFPLAMPLIIGPSVVIMLLVLMSSYGLIITSLGFAGNMFLLYIILRNAKKIQSALGDNGVVLLSKTVDVLLSVFAIMLIRNGLVSLCMRACTSNM